MFCVVNIIHSTFIVRMLTPSQLNGPSSCGHCKLLPSNQTLMRRRLQCHRKCNVDALLQYIIQITIVIEQHWFFFFYDPSRIITYILHNIIHYYPSSWTSDFSRVARVHTHRCMGSYIYSRNLGRLSVRDTSA